MFGFTIIYNDINNFVFEHNHKLVYDSEKSKKRYSFFYKQNNTFINDKIFAENNDFIFGIDGVILNLDSIKKAHSIFNNDELFLNLIKKNKASFFSEFKGDFCGFVFNKESEELNVFTNKTGTKKVFYCKLAEQFIISHSISSIVEFKNSFNYTNNLNINAAYQMLTFGGMIENNTLVNDLFKLNAGECIFIKDDFYSIKKYHDFNNIEVNINDKNIAINRLEDIFIENIKLEYEKDKSSLYEHLATLSGGLDSRMNIVNANNLGYKPHNFCFSQSKYLDEQISRKISNDYKNEYSFIPLDKGNYVFDIQENTNAYEGLIFYVASAHFNYALNNLNISKYGIIHTGQIGDAVLGGFVSNEKEKPNYYSKVISNKLINRLSEINIKNYSSEETFKIYNRLFNVIVSGSYIAEAHGKYLISPFLDAYFIELCLSFDYSLKKDSKIYIEWINKRHKDVANYKWEKTGFKPNANWKSDFSRYTNKAKNVYCKLLNRKDKTSMNPYDYWYANNNKIPAFFDEIFDENINLISDSTLKSDIKMLFSTGNTIEKTMVLTLLFALKKFNIK